MTRSLGQRTFHLRGASWHRFVLPLSAGGRKLLQERGKLRTQLVAAIPGGQRSAGLPLEAPAPRRGGTALVAERLAQPRDLAFEVEQVGFEPVEPAVSSATDGARSSFGAVAPRSSFGPLRAAVVLWSTVQGASATAGRPGSARPRRRRRAPARSDPPSGPAGAGGGSRSRGSIRRSSTSLHRGEVGEALEPLGPPLQLARRLGAAQHQHREHRQLAGVDAERLGSRWRYLRAREPAPLVSRVQPRSAVRRRASETVCSS